MCSSFRREPTRERAIEAAPKIVHLSAIAIAIAALTSCGVVEPTASARPRTASAAPVILISEPEQTGDEEEPPPAPDAATLANGRALAVAGRTGLLSTWQVLHSGALDAASEEALGAPCGDGAACPPPELVSFPEERLELGECRRREAHDVVYLGAQLLVPVDTRAYVMVGMRGAASVRLDGQLVASAASPDRFVRDRMLAPLPLPAGEHRLVLRFDAPPRGRWRGTVRFLSEGTRAGPGNVAIAFPAIPDAEADRLVAGAVRFAERHVLEGDVPTVVVRADLPGGGLERPIEVSLAGQPATLAPQGHAHAARFEIREPMPERGALDLEARAGERSERFGQRVSNDRATLLAAVSLRASLARAPEGSRAPIDWRYREALRVVAEEDADPRWRTWLAREAHDLAEALDDGEDPYGAIRGYERMAFYSRLDGTPQEYELFVPTGYRTTGDRQWPLLVTLHGFKGNAGDYFRNTFGLARAAGAGETLVGHGRHGIPPTSGPMFVIGPTGRGQSFYRHAGEVDIFEAMDDVRRRFRIDASRLYVTGGSMGGTGAAYVPYRNPDVFAASAALAGYHDQRVRSDTNHAELSEAEQFLVAHRSDVDWAENGLYLPMLLVRGTRDRPLSWTRSLVSRLDTLGYRHEHREPELGHNVWSDTYANGAIFRWMQRYRRPEQPRRVRLRTARERTRTAWWVTIEQREAADRFAEVDARIDDEGVIRVQTITGAAAVTFRPTAPLVAEGAPLVVRVGDVDVTGPGPLTIERDGETWRAATQPWPQPGTRRAGASGPIRDVFEEPLTFVVGTQDEDHTLINRLVAARWSHPKGWIVDYPIVDDVDVTEAMSAERALVLIGPPSSNSVLARFADRLPIRVADDGVHLGDATHSGEQVGTAFVAPNPEHPEHAVLVIAGPRALGTWRANDLPDLLPEYVVFDERVAEGHGRWACGGSGACEYLAHGMFDMRMRVTGPAE